MKKIIYIIPLILSSCVFVDNYNECKDSQAFVNEWHNFQLCYPSDWIAKEIPDFNNVMLHGKQIDSSSFKIDGAFQIGVFKLPETENIESAYQANMDNFRSDSVLNNFKIEKEDRIDLDGIKTIRTVYSIQLGKLKTSSIQYYLVFDKKLLIMGGSIPNENLSPYKETYSKIAESIDFKIKN